MSYEQVTLYRWVCDRCQEVEEDETDDLPLGWVTSMAGDHFCAECAS